MGFEDAGVYGEGIAREHDEVGLLAGCERASGFVEIEHFGSGEGEAFKGFLPGHPGPNADGGIAQQVGGEEVEHQQTGAVDFCRVGSELNIANFKRLSV